MSDLTALQERLTAALGPSIISASQAAGELTLLVRRDDNIAVLRHLRDIEGFSSFVDICGADYPDRVERFDVVYHLLSMSHNLRIRVKVTTDEDTPVASACALWPAADWFEREAFDMYGILFSGHPDLRRILTDYGFNGHPLRKDFPLTGYGEVRYDEEQKRVIYEPVKLVQEYRNFDFLSPWEGMLPGDEKAAE
ncbi:NADH-quinone oxidoreductase chain 5 [Candidatus Phycosocius bacilliformis]|uniref:NADH-quinone oxidoreductase subunit C n=1 Tax=Candidatus Phycosocius bacilliformis TaxID=1445552 RepID=A0A2P2EBK2_9PROT|nr:NADH-quinone oxidoreductase subunit C [Candidatus Phycosocius bacilliformis]GBF58456.1 NADH-quinone oxidoreductase chain 5 [Candidatus Phycosocius bacilliformis]